MVRWGLGEVFPSWGGIPRGRRLDIGSRSRLVAGSALAAVSFLATAKHPIAIRLAIKPGRKR